MVNIDSNKLMGLLIIAGGGLLLSQEYIKQRRKRQKWVRPFIRKRDSKGGYYSIINESKLTYKEDFRKNLGVNRSILHITNCKRPLAAIPVLIPVSNFSILYMWTLLIKKFFTTHACFCFYVMKFRK